MKIEQVDFKQALKDYIDGKLDDDSLRIYDYNADAIGNLSEYQISDVIDKDICDLVALKITQ